EILWSLLVTECDELSLVEWDWQAADGCLGKARSGGDCIGPNPTDRGKNGTKKSILVDQNGGPLSAIIAPAQVVDAKLLEQTIEATVVERQKPTDNEPQNLCLDAGYDNPTAKEVVKKHSYQGHIAPRRGRPVVPAKKKRPARRWVVERTLGWLSK